MKTLFLLFLAIGVWLLRGLRVCCPCGGTHCQTCPSGAARFFTGTFASFGQAQFNGTFNLLFDTNNATANTRWFVNTTNGYIELLATGSSVGTINFHDNGGGGTVAFQTSGTFACDPGGAAQTLNWTSGSGFAHPASVTVQASDMIEWCCCNITFPNTLTLTLSSSCAALNLGSVTLTYSVATLSWRGTDVNGFTWIVNGNPFSSQCNNASPLITYAAGGTCIVGNANDTSTLSCIMFSISGTMTVQSGSTCCTVGATATYTLSA